MIRSERGVYFPPGEFGMKITNLGPGTVVYGTLPTVSVFGGSTISAGSSASFTTGRWLIAATASRVQVEKIDKDFERVVHDDVAATPRPLGVHSVDWIGSVEPTNADDDDSWVDTSA